MRTTDSLRWCRAGKRRGSEAPWERFPQTRGIAYYPPPHHPSWRRSRHRFRHPGKWPSRAPGHDEGPRTFVAGKHQTQPVPSIGHETAVDFAADSGGGFLPDCRDALADNGLAGHDPDGAVGGDVRPGRTVEADPDARRIRAGRQDEIVFQTIAFAVERNVNPSPGLVTDHAVKHGRHPDPTRGIVAEKVGDGIALRTGRRPVAVRGAGEIHADGAAARWREHHTPIGEKNLLAARPRHELDIRGGLAAILLETDRSEGQRLFGGNRRTRHEG